MTYQSQTHQMIFKLFNLWKLNEVQRLELLGISEKNIKHFYDYQLGLLIPESSEIAEREAHLLAIHQHLRMLFPEQQKLVYQWMNQHNKSFSGTPIEFVAMKGLSGLIEVRNYLSNMCQC